MSPSNVLRSRALLNRGDEWILHIFAPDSQWDASWQIRWKCYVNVPGNGRTCKPHFHSAWPVLMWLSNQLTQCSILVKNTKIRHFQLIAMMWTNISYQPSDSRSSTVCGWLSWTVNWSLTLTKTYIIFFFSGISLSSLLSYISAGAWRYFHRQQLFILWHSLSHFCNACHHNPDDASESRHCLHSSLFPILTPARTQWWCDTILRAMLQHTEMLWKARNVEINRLTGTCVF